MSKALSDDQRRLVEENMNLVPFIMYKTYSKELISNFGYEDLMQSGYEGLVRAAGEFRPELGYRFSTYAARVIRNEFYRFMRDREREIPQATEKEIELFNGVASDGGEDMFEGTLQELAATEFIGKVAVKVKDEPLAEKIMTLIAKGYSTKEITDHLGITRKAYSNMLLQIRYHARKNSGLRKVLAGN